MELADRSWGDLIRRLPVIVLEDSTLHPDFGLLVWLMVAESKGFYPCAELQKRVFQIVFEVASCPRQDSLSGNGCTSPSADRELPPTLSLKTPTNQMFPDRSPSDDACEVLVRSMLLRAQYGGMKCDVRMLHAHAAAWLRRFRSGDVPAPLAASLAPSASEPSTPPPPMRWADLPRDLHRNARERSEELVAPAMVRPGGLVRLTPADVCPAGIDFHCSAVVDHLLSRSELRKALRERLARPRNGTSSADEAADRDWMTVQLKSMMWNCSSGVNHRSPLFEADTEKNADDSLPRSVWKDVVKAPFDEYTKKFVRDRLL